MRYSNGTEIQSDDIDYQDSNGMIIRPGDRVITIDGPDNEVYIVDGVSHGMIHLVEEIPGSTHYARLENIWHHGSGLIVLLEDPRRFIQHSPI